MAILPLAGQQRAPPRGVLAATAPQRNPLTVLPVTAVPSMRLVGQQLVLLGATRAALQGRPYQGLQGWLHSRAAEAWQGAPQTCAAGVLLRVSI